MRVGIVDMHLETVLVEAAHTNSRGWIDMTPILLMVTPVLEKVVLVGELFTLDILTMTRRLIPSSV